MAEGSVGGSGGKIDEVAAPGERRRSCPSGSQTISSSSPHTIWKRISDEHKSARNQQL